MGIIKIPNKSINFFKKNLDNIFKSGVLAEGIWNKKLEQLCSEYTNIPNAISTSSNGSGLMTVLQLLKRYNKYKYIFLQSNTMYGMSTLAKSSGLKTLPYVDSDVNFLMPTYHQLKKYISKLKKPKETVFLITHIGGWINPDIEKISKLCKKVGIALVEDCAHTLGATLNGKHSGSFGVAGVYSLYSTKAIPAGEGGIIVTNDNIFANMCKRFTIYDRFEQKIDVGFNNRMSEVNALLSYSVLLSVEDIILNKQRIAKKFIDKCKKNHIKFIDPFANKHRSNLYKFIIFPNNERKKKLKTLTSKVYDYALGDDKQKITLKHFCLPIWYKLDKKIINNVLSELG